MFEACGSHREGFMNELRGIRRPERPRKALIIEDQVSKYLRE